MSRLLKLYNDSGRWGNIILLGSLILFGVINRLFMVVKYRYADYIIETLLAALALIIVYKIYKKNLFRFYKQKLFKILFIAGIVLRLVLAIHDFYNRPVQDGDYEKHEKLGARIAFEGEFYDFTGIELRNFRQPGLPVLFALGLWIYNNPVTYAIVMILFSFGAIIAGYYLFKDIENIAALFSFGYLAVSPNMLFMASSSNTQLSFFFFLILLFIVLKNYTGKTYQLIILGALLAAELYIRFNFLMIFIMIPFIFAKHKEEQNTGSSFAKLGLIYLTCLILYSPWLYRNYQIYGKIRLMPPGGFQLYSSNVTSDYTDLGGFNGIPDSVLKKYSNLSEVDFNEALTNDAITFVKNNPEIYIKGLPYRFFKFSGRQDWTISYFFGMVYPQNGFLKDLWISVENLFFWVILFLPFIFLIKFRKMSSLSVYILWAYLSYSILLLPALETRSRYNFPYILFPIFAIAFVDKNRNLTLK